MYEGLVFPITGIEDYNIQIELETVSTAPVLFKIRNCVTNEESGNTLSRQK
jgi:hypothetical protein